MHATLKSSLVVHLQKWLIENQSGCESERVICDPYNSNRNAHLMANAAESVIDAMRLQAELLEIEITTRP